jgi:cytochrome c oxidase cbb3-type subunit IV
MTYEAMRHFADSWFLVGLMIVFLVAVACALRPGMADSYKRLSRLPLDDGEA